METNLGCLIQGHQPAPATVKIEDKPYAYGDWIRAKSICLGCNELISLDVKMGEGPYIWKTT